ncbi:LysM peptidoglycan-binding domain-containing protein [Vibrio parahaemolyticus]|uniref:LysM peptidoglycan-binding domain-containing protein n=1 Tax=Vibrio mediterranei TaxID=689 RepID=UPI004067622C
MRQGKRRPLRVLFLVSVALYPLSGLTKAPLSLNDNVPHTYTVIKGDTLWEIASLYLRSPWRWNELWGDNPHIQNPHLIYPGDTLTLTWVDGQPQLSRKPWMTLSPVIKSRTKMPIGAVAPEVAARYITQNVLMTEAQLDQYPRIVGSSRGLEFVSQHDEIYIDYQGQVQQWVIYQKGESYHAEDSTVTRWRLKPVAVARSDRLRDQMTVLHLTEFVHELKVGDIAMPKAMVEEFAAQAHFSPKPGPPLDQLRILGLLDSLYFAVQGQSVVLNAGASSGIEAGSSYKLQRYSNEFRFSTGQVGLSKSNMGSPELDLPVFDIGQLMVIRVYDHFSIALITDAREPVSPQTILSAATETNDHG